MKNSSSITLLAIACLLCLAGSAWGRVGETPDQIEARYGKPLSNDHPVFKFKQAAALQKLPEDQGVALLANYFEANYNLAKSPYRADALAMLDAAAENAAVFKPEVAKEARAGNANAMLLMVNELRNFYKNDLKPQIYLFNKTLIQVVFRRVNANLYSISEAYFQEADGQITPVSKAFLITLLETTKREATLVPPGLRHIISAGADPALAAAELKTIDNQIEAALSVANDIDNDFSPAYKA